MYRCECGRSFSDIGHLKLHKKVCKGPIYCQNPECGKLLTGYQVKFCSQSCSSKVTLVGRKQSLNTREKISKSLGGTNIKPEHACSWCGKQTTNTKYCSKQCSILDRHPKEYENKNNLERKEILWNEQECKCNRCGYNLYNYKNGPYEIHHKDGNNRNHLRENEELLCCNCHFLTDNYRFKGRKHTKKSKELISKNWSPPKMPL